MSAPEVVVVGGGVVGASVAYHLAERGWRVRVLERRARAGERVPALAGVQVDPARSWAGLYEVSPRRGQRSRAGASMGQA